MFIMNVVSNQKSSEIFIFNFYSDKNQILFPSTKINTSYQKWRSFRLFVCLTNSLYLFYSMLFLQYVQFMKNKHKYQEVENIFFEIALNFYHFIKEFFIAAVQIQRSRWNQELYASHGPWKRQVLECQMKLCQKYDKCSTRTTVITNKEKGNNFLCMQKCTTRQHYE